MGQSFTPVLVRVSDCALVAECAPCFLGGAAIQEYTPEGCIWVEVGCYGTIDGGTPSLRERLVSKYGVLWEIVIETDLHLPRLDMNVDFLKRSLEIDNWGSLDSVQLHLYLYRDSSKMWTGESRILSSAIEAVMGDTMNDIARAAEKILGSYLSPLTTVLKNDGSAIWMWGAYSGDLSVGQVQEIRSEPSARAFVVKAYHPFGKAAAYWRMIRNYVIQRRVFFFWMELPAKGSKRDVDKQEAIATFELL